MVARMGFDWVVGCCSGGGLLIGPWVVVLCLWFVMCLWVVLCWWVVIMDPPVVVGYDVLLVYDVFVGCDH